MGCLIVLIVGLIMMVIAITLAVTNSNFKKDSMTAAGTVLELVMSDNNDSDAYTPKIKFITAAGDTIVFTHSIYSDPPVFAVNEVVKVLYNPESPADAKVGSFFSLFSGSIILFAIGLLIAIPSYYLFTVDRREMKELKFYLRNGTRIEARLLGVEEDSTIRVNDKHPYYIIAGKNINGELFRFKSKSYLSDPSPHLIKVETIVVYLHPFEKNKYLMDTSFVP